jgi:sugar phosphate isomerase/epimerase
MPTSTALTRRRFLHLAGAVPFAAPMLQGAQPNTRIPVGLELFSVRAELAKDLPATVVAVARMGYEVVEFFSPYFTWTPAEARRVRALLDDLGITCRSTHNGAAAFAGDGLSKAIELNQILGSSCIVMASPGKIVGLDGWKALADRLTGVSETLRPLKMTAGYHNHQYEWPVLEGRRPMDVLAAGTPRDFTLQFDVGTCVEMGQDPVAWINANPGRIRSIHCKDWGAGEGRGYAVAFGEGDAPWNAIFAAAEAVGGVEYYLIEQEVSAEPLKMVEHCLANYRKLRA